MFSATYSKSSELSTSKSFHSLNDLKEILAEIREEIENNDELNDTEMSILLKEEANIKNEIAILEAEAEAAEAAVTAEETAEATAETIAETTAEATAEAEATTEVQRNETSTIST